jgi:hypothetical protein
MGIERRQKGWKRGGGLDIAVQVGEIQISSGIWGHPKTFK